MGPNAQIFNLNPLEVTAEQMHQLGTLGTTVDGRRFRYAKAGASNLAVGKLQQAAAELTNHHNMAVQAAVAIGGLAVSVLPGATAGAANLYTDGYMVVNDVTGEGHLYRVKGHAAITASTAFTINLIDPLKVALDTTSEVSLVMNPYKNTVVYPTTSTGPAVGVAPVAVTASYFYWAQVGGICNVLNDGALTVGSFVSPSNAVAGAVENGVIAQGIVGVAAMTGVDTEYRAVLLNIV